MASYGESWLSFDFLIKYDSLVAFSCRCSVIIPSVNLVRSMFNSSRHLYYDVKLNADWMSFFEKTLAFQRTQCFLFKIKLESKVYRWGFSLKSIKDFVFRAAVAIC